MDVCMEEGWGACPLHSLGKLFRLHALVSSQPWVGRGQVMLSQRQDLLGERM